MLVLVGRGWMFLAVAVLSPVRDFFDEGSRRADAAVMEVNLGTAGLEDTLGRDKALLLVDLVLVAGAAFLGLTGRGR